MFQKRTWLKLIPPYLRYYHVIGDETMETTYRFDEEKCVLWVKTPDDYNSLPNKVITAYQAVNETFKFKYLFKTDDDQILVNSHFLDTSAKLLIAKQPKTHYGGYIVDVPKPYLSLLHVCFLCTRIPHSYIVQNKSTNRVPMYTPRMGCWIQYVANTYTAAMATATFDTISKRSAQVSLRASSCR